MFVSDFCLRKFQGMKSQNFSKKVFLKAVNILEAVHFFRAPQKENKAQTNISSGPYKKKTKHKHLQKHSSFFKAPFMNYLKLRCYQMPKCGNFSVYILAEILLKLLVGTGTMERSFSQMKMIKTKIKNGFTIKIGTSH